MRWLSQLAMQIRMLLGRKRAGARLDDELRFHLDRQIAENVAAGMNAEEARTAALRSFGNPALLRDQARATWSWRWLDSFTQDLHFALRSARRSPALAMTVIGTLAVGIGAAAAMYTVVDSVLLRPLPYRDAGRLVLLHEGDRTGKAVSDVPWLDVDEWSKRSRSFDQIAFAVTVGGSNFLEGKSAALQIQSITASPNLFATLGTYPMLGQGFQPEAPSFAAGKNAGAVILSYAVWQAAFGGDAGVIGKAAEINGKPVTVIGVMPRGFFYPQGQLSVGQVWLPLQLGERDRQRDDNSANYQVIGRLRKGVALESAQAEMSAIQTSIASEYADEDMRKGHKNVTLVRYGDTLVDADVTRALLALLAASGVLWLIAAVNVTNLLLARGTARQREIAVRGALGASRRRVMQQMMVEGLVLSAAAAVLGIGLALGGIQVAAKAAPPQLGLDLSPHVNLSVLSALCGLTLLSALVSTAWPAIIAVRAPIEPALKQGGAQAGTGRRHHILRGTLVSAEIAMSLTLLIVCGLLLRTIYALRHVPLGYRTDHIVVANLKIPSFRYANRNLTQELYLPLLDRTQHLHGVEAAGLISEVPLGHTFHVTLSLLMNGGGVVSELKAVSPGIQRIFAFKMLAGRFFNNLDTPSSAPVVVVNPAFAREYAPKKGDPSSLIGMEMWSMRKDAKAHVVGVIDDERQDAISKPSQPEVEICLCQVTPQTKIYGPTTIATDLALRSELPTAEMIPELRDILRQASPELGGARITTMDQIVEDSYGSQRLAAHLLEIFGGAALLLCIGGLYGLLAYVVAQRTRELGVRIALGAPRARLLWLVMRQAGAMLLIGVTVGTALALASGRLVRGYLYGVSAQDGWTVAGAAALLLVSGLVAAYLPARRAASVDPMQALRTE